MKELFNSIYKDRRVFLTGNTGFKGSWMAAWLKELGADLTGYALDPESTPNHWEILNLPMDEVRGDIRNFSKLLKSIQDSSPEIVFHFAAQSLVRRSYEDPLDTWSTNVMGTANVLEACRKAESVQAVIIVTTDKVYENREWYWGYREVDRLGGYDPYSASKAASEIVVDSYRKSFFNTEASRSHIASVRGGNVIGGGDWSSDRLIPDLIRAVESGTPLMVRSPHATRPWQHVLDCLSGYLLLGQRLLENEAAVAGAWNFGPDSSDNRKVLDVLNRFKKRWPQVEWTYSGSNTDKLHESTMLYLDSSKANQKLGWQPIWSLEEALKHTAEWYKTWFGSQKELTHKQLAEFVSDAHEKKCIWTQNNFR